MKTSTSSISDKPPACLSNKHSASLYDTSTNESKRTEVSTQDENHLFSILKSFEKVECKKEINKIYYSDEGLFFTSKNSIYQNSTKIVSNSNKINIKNFTVQKEDILFFDEENNLKFFSKYKEDTYLIVREYKIKTNIQSISFLKKKLAAITETKLLLMNIASQEIIKVQHDLNVNEDTEIIRLQDSFLIKTNEKVVLFDTETKKFVSLFSLKSFYGNKIISISINNNSVAMLTDKYILFNDRAIEFKKAVSCKIFKLILIVATEDSLIIFNKNLYQIRIYNLKKGFKWQINASLNEIQDTNVSELEKTRSFFEFWESISEEKIKRMEDELVLSIIRNHGSLIKNTEACNPQGLLINQNHNFFFRNPTLIKKESPIQKKSVFFKEFDKEINNLEAKQNKQKQQDFLIERFRYSKALNYLLELNDTKEIIDYLDQFKNKGVLKFLLKKEANRNKILDFFLENKNYLMSSELFVYILDFLIKDYEIDIVQKEAIKEALNVLFRVNVDSCMISGYLEDKIRTLL
ncbi:hypothetical protein CDIK_0674 [Cucumispora dikerogammari]|nr:hypothetical protein CDIK_0674 [Cucumispora dikerogammari]